MTYRNDALAFNTAWRWKSFIVFHIIAGLLLVTFFYDPSGSLWEWVDEAVFFALNGILFHSETAQKIFAYSNTKLYDKLSTALLVTILLVYVFLGWGEDVGKRLAAALFLGSYMLIMTYGRREFGIFEIGRPSPSLTMQPFLDLRERFPDMRPKTESGNSFPGDHAIASLIFVSLFWYFANWKAGMASLVLIPLFNLPRLAGGAHWFSDVVVGGGFFAILVVTWALCTPFAGICCRGLYGIIRKIENRLLVKYPLSCRRRSS